MGLLYHHCVVHCNGCIQFEFSDNYKRRRPLSLKTVTIYFQYFLVAIRIIYESMCD